MNVVQEITRIKEAEAKMGIFGGISKVYTYNIVLDIEYIIYVVQ